MFVMKRDHLEINQYNLLSTPESPVLHCTLEASLPWSLSPGPGGKVEEVHTLVEMRICDCRSEPAARLTRCELWSWVSHSTLSPVLMMQVTPVSLSLAHCFPSLNNRNCLSPHHTHCRGRHCRICYCLRYVT